MKRLLFSLAYLFSFFSFSLAQSDSSLLKSLQDEIMLHGTCYENLRVLTQSIGHRLSGSPQAEKAVQWGLKTMREAGADTAWLQPALVPHWVRGNEWLQVKLPGSKGFEPMRMTSLGNSIGSGKPVEAPVIMVQTMDEFYKLSPAAVAGKIVFFNYRFRQDIINTFEGYGDAIKYRILPPVAVAQKGGVGVIIRSVGTGVDDVPHTGVTRIVDSVRKIPCVAIGYLGANRLEAACRQGGVTARVLTSGKMLPPVLSYNVIGEIKGSEFPNEYVIAGGHLDSWDVGQGAQDDGAGCVQSIEIIRAFKKLGIRPKRSVRAVLFMNEENGSKGAHAYADSAVARHEKHVLAIESDAGGFSPRGFGMDMPLEKKSIVRSWLPYFLPMGVYDFSGEDAGVDVSPLGKSGAALAGLYPDSQRYFDIHHTDEDRFDKVSHRELKLGAAAMATLVWLASQYGL
ncbi:MAG: M20/M25/M40 family metallo-hydrolase [Bacteroidetes bacterium]|nr:M20/M25/M40 family metallo-hydrolase [Bacteroidota bacterium]